MYIAVDFDGTVVDHAYPDVGRNAPDVVRVLNKLVAKGHKLILFTMRSGQYLHDAQDWFETHEIELYGVQTNPTQKSWTDSPKAYAQIYIDDAALGAPLIDIAGFNRPCVNWEEVERLLVERGVL